MTTCKECGKEFPTERGLATHRGIEHRVGVGGKPIRRVRGPVTKPAPGPLPALDLKKVAQSPAVREIGETVGKLYGDLTEGFVAGMKDAMRSARRKKTPTPQQPEAHKAARSP